MTISSYQVDNLIKAYSKRNKARLLLDIPQAAGQENKYQYLVTLSSTEDMRAEAYKKISYNLLDVLLKR
ncbi:MAG: hypothetical protein CVU74_01380 [Deltaproteobacteria bacterium HGW-Deltaproteobacteria-9]|nr:MAG: hypothetical protein CVU74_01380 [Deltaproteobacteria bacterium HGW-Deltaproteobacteria-9]